MAMRQFELIAKVKMREKLRKKIKVTLRKFMGQRHASRNPHLSSSSEGRVTRHELKVEKLQ